MSEYEMISALQGYSEQGASTVMAFFTILVAYLVAGHLAASRLALLTSIFLAFLFLASSVNSIVVLYGLCNTAQGLLDQMHKAAADGKVLQWHPIAQQPADVWATGGPALAVLAFASMGAMIFFFVSRRQHLTTATLAKS